MPQVDLGIDWEGLNLFMEDLMGVLERIATALEKISKEDE